MTEEFEHMERSDIVRQMERVLEIQKDILGSFRLLLFDGAGKKICDLICDNELDQVLNDYLEKKIEKLKKRLSELDGDLGVRDEKVPDALDFNPHLDKDFDFAKDFRCPHCGKEYKDVLLYALWSPYTCECGGKFNIPYSPRV